MTLPAHLDEKQNGGRLRLIDLRNVFKIEEERFIKFSPFGNAIDDDYIHANTVLEGLASFFYYTGSSKPYPDYPENSLIKKMVDTIKEDFTNMKPLLPEKLVFVMEVLFAPKYSQPRMFYHIVRMLDCIEAD